jgi:hypothetical protein
MSPKETIMFDPNTVKLGKLAPAIDHRTLKLERYIAGLPAPPPSANWYSGITEWGMMLNATLGDCTCAAYGHGAQVVTLNTPTGLVTPPDILIENLYEKACGYVPGDPSTDQGGVILNVLNQCRQNGLGHKRPPHHPHKKKFPLYAYAAIKPSDIAHVKWAIELFGVIDIGLQLPISAQSQEVWDVVEGPNGVPGSWGGHSVVISSYDSSGLTCITWGQLQKMTWAFWAEYVDEAYALFYTIWMERMQTNFPSGLAMLEQDLKEVSAD